mgnify:FL=1
MTKNIKEVNYSEDRKQLTITMADGVKHKFDNVTPSKFAKFINLKTADEKSQFIKQLIER